MASTDSFAQMLLGVRARDAEAEKQLFQTYWHALIALAAQNLSDRIRQREDPEDVVQSVYKSLVGLLRQNKCEMTDRHKFWNLLVAITLNKCRDRVVRCQAQKRDVRKEVRLLQTRDDSNMEWELSSREPSPDEVAELNDLIEHLMLRMEQRERRIFALALQEVPIAAISAEIGRSESSVRRFLDRLRTRLLQMRDAQLAG